MKELNEINPTLQRWSSLARDNLVKVNLLHSFPKDSFIKEFESIIEHNLKHHGVKYTIDLLKSYKLLLQRIVLGQEIIPIPFCKADKKGFPLVLKPWYIAHDSSVERKRYVMSYWRIIDMFRIEPIYDVNSIISESTSDKTLIDDIVSFASSWKGMRLLGSTLLPGYLVMSSKAGPNGPASLCALEDLAALRREKDLYNNVKRLLRLSVPGLNIDSFQATSGKITSKLVLLADKACKTRVVAIGDWWSNTSLSGIHKTFMKALRSLKTDVTFRQDQVPILIKGIGAHLYSADMKNFTDRFPRELLRKILNLQWPGLGDLWEQVISNRVFSHPKGDVKYSAGNPMGLLSSWPISSFVHHIVINYCAFKQGINNYNYIVLGDDSVQPSRKVYETYILVMGRLGVQTSLAKCTQSDSGNTEFAKRLFYSLKEVTGLPVNLLADLDNKPEQFIELVRIARERGYSDQDLVPGISLLLSNHKNGKMVADVLSLPETALGMPPLLEVKPGSWAEQVQLSDSSLEDAILVARNAIFWEKVEDLITPRKKPLIRKEKVFVPEHHPVLVAISEKLMVYMDQGEDEYSIYNEWMKGNYREMAHVPNIDNYRYKNKGHFTTKCKYDVLSRAISLIAGNCNVNLFKPSQVSNWDLFSKGYPSEQ